MGRGMHAVLAILALHLAYPVIAHASVTLSFTGPNNASLGYAVGNVTATKIITRQLF